MVSSRLLPPLPNDPTKVNWVEEAGGLPDYMVRVAKHIYAGGATLEAAIAGAISQTKKRAADGNKEAIAAVAQWEKMKASTHAKKLSVSEKYRNEAPTVTVKGKSAYPIKGGDRKKLIAAIKLYKMHKAKYPPQKRNEIKAHIKRAAKKMGVSVGLSVPEMVGPKRNFNEAKYRRVGGKFAPKPSTEAPTSKSKPQTAKATIEALGVGANFDIPGISGNIKRTEQGYVVTGPNGFKTTASTATEAIAVAARLIRQKMNEKAGAK